MAEMARITVSLPRDLHRKAKIKAVATGISMSAVCRKALKVWSGQEKFERAIETLPRGKSFNENELKAFLRAMAQDEWWTSRCCQGGIQAMEVTFYDDVAAMVTFCNKDVGAGVIKTCSEVTMNLPQCLWCETVVLHELAHIITPVVGLKDMHNQEFIENWCAMLGRYTNYGKKARTILEGHGFPT